MMDNLDVVEKIMLLVGAKDFASVCLVNQLWCSVGLSIIERRKNSQDPEKIMWFVRYLTNLIKFPFPENDRIEVKPAIWGLAKWRLKRLMVAKNVAAYRLYIKLLMKREKVLSLFYPVDQLELLLGDGSSSYEFAKYLKKSWKTKVYRTRYIYTKYVEYLWNAHRKGHPDAFWMLLKRYSHSESKLNRISTERTLTVGEDRLVLLMQAKLLYQDHLWTVD